MSTARLVDTSFTHLVEVPPVRVLFYPQGPPGIEHICKTVSQITIICAPRLRHDHIIVSATPLTIHPSILCPDCGLHGFITDGVWIPA